MARMSFFFVISMQVVSNSLDTKLREDLERLKKIRNHRGLRHYWGLRVRGQRTKTTGRRGRTVGEWKPYPGWSRSQLDVPVDLVADMISYLCFHRCVQEALSGVARDLAERVCGERVSETSWVAVTPDAFR